jgi:hypothetical protein
MVIPLVIPQRTDQIELTQYRRHFVVEAGEGNSVDGGDNGRRVADVKQS